MIQKSRHYAAQAAIQATLEAGCREEEARLKQEAPGFLDGEEFVLHESEDHAALRRTYERLASHPWERPPADLPIPFPWDRNRDREVIEAALEDLMDPRNPENAITSSVNGPIGSEIVLNELTWRWSVFLPREPRWEGLDGTVVDEAFSDLLRRNGGGAFPLSELALRGRWPIQYDDLNRLYIAAVDHEEPFWDYFHRCHPNARGCLWAILPGYSKDGRTAVVGFAAPHPHGEYWTYTMHKTTKGWEITRREHDVRE
jgi:hypothetical protein